VFTSAITATRIVVLVIPTSWPAADPTAAGLPDPDAPDDVGEPAPDDEPLLGELLLEDEQPAAASSSRTTTPASQIRQPRAALPAN
jgi:hypothetical protein